MRKNSSTRGAEGFSLVEVVIATTILLVFTVALVQVSKSGTEAHEFNGRQNWLTEVGQISDSKREEFIHASDVFGLSMLVVQQNNRFTEGATTLFDRVQLSNIS